MRTHFSRRKKRGRLPLHVYAAYLFITTLLLTGASFSRYITTTSTTEQSRVASIGSAEIAESGDFFSGSQMLLLPGCDLNKSAEITCSPSTMDRYLFLKVELQAPEGYQWNHGGAPDPHAFAFEKGTSPLMTWKVDSTLWTPLEAASSPSTAVYWRKVPPNEAPVTFPILKDNTVVVSDTIQRKDMKELADAPGSVQISFSSAMTQFDGFAGPKEAWSSVELH